MTPVVLTLAVIACIVVWLIRYINDIFIREAIEHKLHTLLVCGAVDDVRAYYVLQGHRLRYWQQQELYRWLEDHNAFGCQPVPEGVEDDCEDTDGEDQCIREAVSVEGGVQPSTDSSSTSTG